MPINNSGRAIHILHILKSGVHSHRAQSSDPSSPQASQRLQIFGAWLFSYLGATHLLIRRRRRSYSQWFSWLGGSQQENSLPSCLIQEGHFFFNPPWRFFFKRKAFWRRCTSSKPLRWRSESFLANLKWQEYKTQQDTLNLWRVFCDSIFMWSGILLIPYWGMISLQAQYLSSKNHEQLHLHSLKLMCSFEIKGSFA